MSQKSSTGSASEHILIAGIGNIFFGDDGFGVEVAQRLLSRQAQPYADHVQVIDFGIRGLELAYTLLDEEYDTLVLVDTVSRGSKPGTLYLIEPDLAKIGPAQDISSSRFALDSHSMDPLKVLTFARTLGAPSIRTLLLGCEPSRLGGGEDGEEMQMGLSQPVQAAAVQAVSMLDSLVERLVTNAPPDDV
jgi:hydrogenase maturation protease